MIGDHGHYITIAKEKKCSEEMKNRKKKKLDVKTIRTRPFGYKLATELQNDLRKIKIET